MFKYTLKRIILAFITVCIILSLTFILMRLLPFSQPGGFPSQIFAYYQKQVNLGFVISSETELKGFGSLLWKYDDGVGNILYYYQRPVLEQYASWVTNIFTKWDWGTSTYLKPGFSAIGIIGERLPNTIKVNVFSVILSVPLGIGLGIWAALKKNKLTDHLISTLVMVFISIPSFVVITFMMSWFGYQTGWLPTQWPSDSATTATRVAGYVIPVLALSFGSVCGYCRYTRAELCEVMSSEYLLLARTKGLTRRQSIIRHALRNAMVPIVPSILAEFIGILGGSMILENLYGIRGIGDLYITALNNKDYNVLMVDMAVFTTISLVAGVFLDLSYGLIDPRIRMGAR